MNRATLNFIIECSAAWMAARHPDYRVEKKRGKAGARTRITFSKRRDEQRCVWIEIAGENSSNFLEATISWTQQGDSLDDLEDEYVEEANAARGWMQLTDEELVGDDVPPDRDRLLGLGDPPFSLQQAAFAAWQKTDMYERERELLAQQMRKKNPAVNEAVIEAEQQRCYRATFQGWSAIEMALKLDEEQLTQVTDVLLSKIYYLLDKYALPFLESKLNQSTDAP